MGTGALDGIQGDAEELDADVDADYDRLDWTVIDIPSPVWKVVEIALPTELDLAVIISCVPIFIKPNRAIVKLRARRN